MYSKAKKFFGPAMIFTAALALPGATFACGGPESQTHIGNVTSVDPNAKTFTIQDMESQKPITFAANDRILMNLSASNSKPVTVDFKEQEGKFIAVSVR